MQWTDEDLAAFSKHVDLVREIEAGGQRLTVEADQAKQPWDGTTQLLDLGPLSERCPTLPTDALTLAQKLAVGESVDDWPGRELILAWLRQNPLPGTKPCDMGDFTTTRILEHTEELLATAEAIGAPGEHRRYRYLPKKVADEYLLFAESQGRRLTALAVIAARAREEWPSCLQQIQHKGKLAEDATIYAAPTLYVERKFWGIRFLLCVECFFPLAQEHAEKV